MTAHRSLAHWETTTDCFDVIVVENGSGDASARPLGVSVPSVPIVSHLIVNRENLGFAGGVRSAWTIATGELICLLSEIASVRDGTHNVIGTNIWMPLLRTPDECFTASGVCLLLVRGPASPPFLAEYFAYLEDVFLRWRLRLLSPGSERVPSATIYHDRSLAGRADPDLRSQVAPHAERNRLTNMSLLNSAESLFRILRLIILDETKKVLMFLADLLRGRFRRAISYATLNVRARWWILRRFAWISARRREIQSRRSASDASIFPLMSGRLAMDDSRSGRWLNRLSMSYCRLAGIRTVEFDA